MDDFEQEILGERKIDRNKLELLIVEDEEGPAQAMLNLLSELYDVTWYQDGHDALEYLRNADVSAVLIDIRSPFMDGIELFKRAREEYPSLPLIFWSAVPSDSNTTQYCKQLTPYYIAKGADHDYVLNTIAKAVGEHD